MLQNILNFDQKNSKETIHAIFSGENLINENLPYFHCVKDLLQNETVLEMKHYIQHGNTNCYQHCINVSYYSYLLCEKLGLDKQSVARAGLLHDLFLYDWHKRKKEKNILKKHGFTHPYQAFYNANKYFNLNEKEKDIILKHMWPLTVALPKYKESFLVSLVDKICCILEFMNYHFPFSSKEIKEKYQNIIDC